MAGSSHPLNTSERIQDLEYLYASNANVSNFVSVKLSSDRNYHIWKTQMLCLLRAHNMGGIVDDAYVSPRASRKEIMDQYDSLLKGWIFGSASENVLGTVIDLDSAKDVWNKLKSIYDATISHQQDAEIETGDIDAISAQTNTDGEDAILIDVDPRKKNKFEKKKKLHEATMKGNWSEAEKILKANKDLVKRAISSDGSMVLHIAVGIGHNDIVKNLFSYMSNEDILRTRISDGSTALHIAAIVGNKNAADLLVKKNKSLLRIKDRKGKEPLHKAYENMHLDTIEYLLKADDENEKTVMQLDDEIGVDLLVNAISAKEYKLALALIGRFPELASKSDSVLMAIAKTFPHGDYQQTYIYLSWKEIWILVCDIFKSAREFLIDSWGKPQSIADQILSATSLVLSIVIVMLVYLITVACLPIFVLYILWGKGTLLVEPITHMQKRKTEMDEAEKVLEMVCDEIDKLEFKGTHHPHYTRPILEAACQNAHKVVDEILYRSPEAILSRDQSGYDIIQLAVIYRSERIYNLIYDIGERKNLYRTIVDSSKNNILHLAGRLAPSRKLNHTTGAALQLQGELQWRQEVKEVVYPTYITQENIFKETPDMVFTREHANLLKEGEQWMKTTAESCSITAALITTIVFAAAITVPGGSNEETGIPVFTNDIAFIIFGISNAISLFASSTALLVFLSILTARFSEKDFLVSLPRRMLIGICSLLLSAISMMVAFSSTLFLVFCHKKLWMLAPICGLSLIPISFFVALQLPLIVDLFRSTYLRKFGPRKRGFS
ncbi:ankyrin repeat-containing domain, PGG domain, Gag-polypeptide of LTR copia-type [Artemisia annua]|uniref:Ankyrin repeat-containing domain, PGG domain, Gag-polypeptide of LTR copia-type n=1 Tax=Artemisia annua TaxID=35608 RepID=A0A2U1NN59_ARTAN|nr:ankyrin repeat-containing domain, PGG domain, Gag-polypeptide of LTR copia-type [Artemisia annua]